MTPRSDPPRPRARWQEGTAPAWAVRGAERCAHEARTPGDPQARSAPDRLPDTAYCARPYGHAGDHAAPPREVLARLGRRGWWSWPDDGVRSAEDERRERAAVVRTGRPPSMAPVDERACRAGGEAWHEAQAGRIRAARWSEPVHCSRPVGHDAPHATAPRPHRCFGADWPADTIDTGPPHDGPMTWWQWPPPPPPEPTTAQRVRARLGVAVVVLVAALILVAVALVAAG